MTRRNKPRRVRAASFTAAEEIRDRLTPSLVGGAVLRRLPASGGVPSVERLTHDAARVRRAFLINQLPSPNQVRLA